MRRSMYQTGDRVNNALYVRAILKQKKQQGSRATLKLIHREKNLYKDKISSNGSCQIQIGATKAAHRMINNELVMIWII